MRYVLPMAISNFIDREAELIWSGARSRRLPATIQTTAIRIDDQWRICFRWQAGHVLDVEITDYH